MFQMSQHTLFDLHSLMQVICIEKKSYFIMEKKTCQSLLVFKFDFTEFSIWINPKSSFQTLPGGFPLTFYAQSSTDFFVTFINRKSKYDVAILLTKSK